MIKNTDEERVENGTVDISRPRYWLGFDRYNDEGSEPFEDMFDASSPYKGIFKNQ